MTNTRMEANKTGKVMQLISSTIIFFGLMLVTAYAQSDINAVAAPQNVYVDIVYQNSDTVLPQRGGWLRRMFKNDEKKVMLVATILKTNTVAGGNIDAEIVRPPFIVEEFELVGSDISRKNSKNINLSTSQLIPQGRQMLLSIDFYSVKKSLATAFAKNLESLATFYLAAGATPAVSKLTMSAMNAISDVIGGDREIHLTQLLGLDLAKSNSNVTIYFLDGGRIENTLKPGERSEASITFNITAKSEITINFSQAFPNQPISDHALSKYREFRAAGSSSVRMKKCRELEDVLLENYDRQTTNSLLAIAINDAKWAQDEIGQPCIGTDLAIQLKKDKGLLNLVNCDKELCQKTKQLMILVSGGSPDMALEKYFGSTLNPFSCKTSTNFTAVSKWRTVRGPQRLAGITNYTVKSCLTTSAGASNYLHTFSWDSNDILIAHSCEKLTTDSTNCN